MFYKIVRKFVAGALAIGMVLFLMPTAYALPSMRGLFDPDDDALQARYKSTYYWDENKMTAETWNSYIDGESVRFERKYGFQKEFLEDNILTTKQYLGLVPGGATLGSGEGIVAVALAEVGRSDSYESPLGSDNVKYNTWYYGRPVRNVDTNRNGQYDYGDSQFYPWCCVFVTWCAEQCGLVSEEILPRSAGCTTEYRILTDQMGYSAYFIKDTTPMGGYAYTPVPGDLMFFHVSGAASSYSFGHIGIIVEVTEDGWWTVEGNSSDKVSKNYYSKLAQSDEVTRGSVVHIEYPE